MSGLRIGGGTLRGRLLLAPKGERTRPTSGRLKKSLFDVLGDRLRGARVLDLYAGAGALGIEALSRGARFVVFVEKARSAAATIERNLDALDLETKAKVVRGNARSLVSGFAASGETFDLVFADPPYASDEAANLLKELGEGGCLVEHAWVAVEHHHKSDPGDRHGTLERFRVIRAGESSVSLFQKAEASGQADRNL